MNTMHGSFCRYKAITADGKVHYLGYASEFTYDDMVYQKSRFGGKLASYEFCSNWDEYGEKGPPRPKDLVRIVNPADIEYIWNGKRFCGAKDLAHMFSLCHIPEETVVGMILTYEEDGRWDLEHSVETFVISRTPQTV